MALGGAPDARAQAAGGDGGAVSDELVGGLTGERVLDAHGAWRRIRAAQADVAAGVDGECGGVGEHARCDVDRHPLGAPAEVEPHARGDPKRASGLVEVDVPPGARGVGCGAAARGCGGDRRR